MRRILTATALLISGVSLSACDKRVQLDNNAIYVQYGPYADYCWMYGDSCLTPPATQKRPVKNAGRREKVLIRKY